jgi:hypothetical protein
MYIGTDMDAMGNRGKVELNAKKIEKFLICANGSGEDMRKGILFPLDTVVIVTGAQQRKGIPVVKK